MLITADGEHALQLNKPSREKVILLATGDFKTAVVTAGYLNSSKTFTPFNNGLIASGEGYEYLTGGIPVIIKVTNVAVDSVIDLTASGV